MKSNFTFFLRALRYRNYRLFFMGQIISLIGTWMTTTATSWLIYRLTGSALLLGVVSFAGQIPAFLLAPLAGIYVDRWNQHRLLVATQTLSMVQSGILAVLTLTGNVSVAAVLLLNVAEGFINAFDMPCRQAFVVSMIEKKEDLGNAIALNSSVFNAARLVGPSIAGLIIIAWGEGVCFLIDSLSFMAVIAALLLMKLKPKPPKPPQSANTLGQLKEGWNYVRTFRPIRAIILLLAMVSLLGVPYMVLVPVFAGKILHGGPHTLGFLMTASGCGALLGAMWLATRKTILGLGRTIPIATAIFSAGLIAFSFSRTLWLSLVLMVVTGFGLMVQWAGGNTIVQTIVDDNKRGRVMSFFMMAFLGTAPFGSLLAGKLADKFGAPATMLACGISCALAALWFASRVNELRDIRPIYARIGIIPDSTIGAELAGSIISDKRTKV